MIPTNPAKLQLPSLSYQNSNTLAGVEFISTTFAGTATGLGDYNVVFNQDAPWISITGTQTASNIWITMSHVNATHGANVVIKRQLATPGTGIITISDGTAGGTIIGIIPTNANGNIDVTFDGVAQVWR